MVERSPLSPHLRLAEEKFRLLVESVKDYAIFMLDVDGHIVSWNLGAERLKGYSANEIIGSHFSRFYSDADNASGKPEYELKRALEVGRVEDEGWRIRKDGSRFWANVVITALRDESGTLVGFGKVTRDLTERKETEERLRASEEQFRTLVSGVEEYAIFMLDPTGRIMTWNLGGERIKGYAAKEIIGESFERFFTPEDRAKGEPAHLLESARKLGHIRSRGPRVKKDGTIFHVEGILTAIFDKDGILRGFSKVTRDITDQIRNREMEAAKLAAEKANAAKDEFLAVLSHELRTPLTPVLAAASYLADNAAKLPPELRDEVGMIRRNVQLEAQLIDDLLDLTRITRGKIELNPEGVDVHTTLLEVIQICKENVTGKELEISTSLHAREHWIWADPVRIRQVFWNVISNAVKFTPQHGRISIRSSNNSSGHLQIEVSDTGMGIGREQIGTIFAAFDQGAHGTARRFGGLGLGLAITKNLVDLHHGSISAASEGPGKGATFTIILPHSSPHHLSPHEVAAELPNGTRTLRILLVEDHEDTRRILCRLLRQQQHQVATANSVQSAIECLDSEQFDVLISDIGLPDNSGLELIRIAKQWQSLKGIALSGFGMEEDINRSKQAGFDYHLTKPVEFKELQAALSSLFL